MKRLHLRMKHASSHSSRSTRTSYFHAGLSGAETSMKLLARALFYSFVLALSADVAGAQTKIDRCAVITAPGSYVLAKDITASESDLHTFPGPYQICIPITADFVTFDLDGHTIFGPGTGYGVAVYCSTVPCPFEAATLRNGSVTNFDIGVSLSNRATVEHVRAIRNIFDGIQVGNGSTVKDNDASENGRQGIFVGSSDGSAASIIGNVANKNSDFGLVVHCPATLINNAAAANGQQDISTVLAFGGTVCTRLGNSPAP